MEWLTDMEWQERKYKNGMVMGKPQWIQEQSPFSYLVASLLPKAWKGEATSTNQGHHFTDDGWLTGIKECTKKKKKK